MSHDGSKVNVLLISEDSTWAQQLIDESKVQGLTIFHGRFDESGRLPQSIVADVLIMETNNVSASLKWWLNSPFKQKPFALLANRFTDDEVIQALQAGVQDCLMKSLSPKLLCTKLRTMLRRLPVESSSRRQVERYGLVIDSDLYLVQFHNNKVELTLTEFKILRELAREDEKVIPRADIQAKVFGEVNMSNRSMDVHICALRKKISPYHVDVESVRGVGYRLRSLNK